MAPSDIRSEQINELAAALAKAQGVLEGALKGKVNPAFKTKYADLASVWDAAREPLSSNGLSVVQLTQEAEGGMVLVTMLMHSSGQWVSSRYPIRPVKSDPQGYGSALSYARRYSLMSVVGVSPEEDDGNAAGGHGVANANGGSDRREPPRQGQQEPSRPDPRYRQRSEAISAKLADIDDVAGVTDLWTKHLDAIKEIREYDPVAYKALAEDFRLRKAEVAPPAGLGQDDRPDPLPEKPRTVAVPTDDDGEPAWGQFADYLLGIVPRVTSRRWGEEFLSMHKFQISQLAQVRDVVGTFDGKPMTGTTAAARIRGAMAMHLDAIDPPGGQTQAAE